MRGPNNVDRHRIWLLGVLLATICGLIYLAVRPPLYDNDGYRDRLYALSASWYWPNPHHLLWNFFQAFLATVSAHLGYPTSVPFQIAGIIISSLTLSFLFALLCRGSDNRIFAVGAVTFVAFSPRFWSLTLENRPYALLFLVFVLYLLAWQTRDGSPPSGSRLVVAGALITIAALLHQAAIFLAGIGALVLIARDRQTRSRWLVRGLMWGGTIAAVVFVVYVIAWESIVRGDSTFFYWTTDFAQHLHNLNLLDLGVGVSLLKSIIATSGVVVRQDAVQELLSDYSSPSIYAIYASMAALVCGGMGLAVWRYRLGRPILKLLQTDACFALSVTSFVLWWAFMLTWEATPHYYALLLFPGFFCLASVAKGRVTPRAAWAFAGVCFVMSILNGYLNHQHDLVASRNFPPPLIAQVREHVGNGIFIVLAKDGGIGGMDYDLLLTSLEETPGNPAVAIIDDLARPAKGSPIWHDSLRAKIDASLDAGLPVFVAAHVLNRDAYEGLSGVGDPYAAFVSKGDFVAEAPSFYEEVSQIFAAYKLEPSNFRLGVEKYFLLKRAGAG